MTQKQYTIGKKNYYLRPLVLGQVEQLKDLVEGTKFDLESLNATQIVAVLGDQLPQGLAIILTEEDVELEDKDVDKLAKTLKFTVDIELAIILITDFFGITPISSLWTKIVELINKVGEAMSVEAVEQK